MKALALTALSLLLFTGCATTTPSIPQIPVAQLKPVLHAAMAIAVADGKLTPELAATANTAIDAAQGTPADLPTLWALVKADPQFAGKLSPKNVATIEAVIALLQGLQAPAK